MCSAVSAMIKSSNIAAGLQGRGQTAAGLHGGRKQLPTKLPTFISLMYFSEAKIRSGKLCFWKIVSDWSKIRSDSKRTFLLQSVLDTLKK